MIRRNALLCAVALTSAMPVVLQAGPVWTHAGGVDLSHITFNTNGWIRNLPTDPVPADQGDVFGTPLNPIGGSSSTHSSSNHAQGYTVALDGSPTGFPFFWTADCASTFTSSAGGGALHANAVSHANFNNFTQTYSYLDKDGNANAITHDNPYFAEGFTQGTAEFHDVLHITSTTLAPNAPVVIKLHFILDSNVSLTPATFPGGSSYSRSDAQGQLTAQSTRPLGHDNIFGITGLNGENTGTDPVIIGEALLGTFVGDSIDLAGSLEVDATAYCMVDYDPYALALYGTTSADAFADASNTMHSYVEVITPGVSFFSDSGATYSAGVPEPASLGVLGLGVVLFAGRRRR